MMEETVKTLSTSKKRKSLGEASKQEKTKKKNVRVRTTVINPNEIQWPDIDEDGKNELISMIKSLAVALKIPFRKVPLKEIREIEKTERQEFRKQWISNEAMRLNFCINDVILLRSSLAIGINCVSKALDLNQLVAVIIEQNTNPPILTKLLVPLANSKNIPIIAVQGLSYSFQESANLRCSALGLKKSCENISHHFHPLLKLIWKLLSNDEKTDEMCSTQSSPKHPELVPEPLHHSTPITLSVPKESDIVESKPLKRKNLPIFQKPKVRRLETNSNS